MTKYLFFIAAISGTIFYFFGVTSEKFSASYPYPVAIVYDHMNRGLVSKEALLAEGDPRDLTILQDGERNKTRIFTLMADGDPIGTIELAFVPRDEGRRSDIVGTVKPAMVNGSGVRLKDARAIATALDVKLGNYNRLAMKAQAEGYESIEAMVYGSSLGAKMAFGEQGAKDWGNQVAGLQDQMRAQGDKRAREQWTGKGAYGSDLQLKQMASGR